MHIRPGGGATHGLAGGPKSYECVSASPNVHFKTTFGTLQHWVLFVGLKYLITKSHMRKPHLPRVWGDPWDGWRTKILWMCLNTSQCKIKDHYWHTPTLGSVCRPEISITKSDLRKPHLPRGWGDPWDGWRTQILRMCLSKTQQKI